MVSELKTLSGSEFQTVGAATEKARMAKKTVRVRGTASLIGSMAGLHHTTIYRALLLITVQVILLRNEWML